MQTLEKLSASFKKQLTTLLIKTTKNALSELKKLDTLLVELSKNGHLSYNALQDLGDHAFEVASKYGRSAVDYLSSTLAASRSGYKNPEAMAELSLTLQSAGNIPADLADQLIFATDKAWQMNGSISELTKTLDGMYYITSQNPVNLRELSQGMSAISSKAASLGLDANETAAALATMLNATDNDGADTADALQAILLFTRQISDETVGIDTASLAEYENACNALNVKLKETKYGVTSLRAPMEVLGELSAAYQSLADSDPRKSGLLDSVGGSFHASQLDTILSQWDTYESMLQQYSDGTNFLAMGAEQTASSWENSLNRLSNTWTAVISNIADSKTFTTMNNNFNSFLSILNKVTDNLSSIDIISLGAGLFAGIKNVGRLEKSGPVIV